MTEIWVVRHGETPWNVERRVQGWQDTPLNENGINQAHALGRHLARLHRDGPLINAIYSSDLTRAHHTAQIAGQAIGLTPIIEKGVRERHFGVLQGLIFHTMDEHQPEAAKIWRSRDPEADLPEGESLGTFHRRVVKALDNIAAKHVGQRVMVVSHGGAMDIIWRHASQVDLRAARQTPMQNASINRIEVSPNGWRIIDWGDVSHLSRESDDDVTA
ncbi:histidine phosphatase family protein [Orrella sp. NBD-18]|uniref:Histidine phosphatase family protein n=1 Tax=Sheuella amnicola TaxID=2707330 RepID=A0A6B2QZ92_9BURK|nr:histidine phosphatase family protein [Sheuella amnicola]NDY83830.1 histidine phosphatase family protein [Sheuella amnicola]HBI82822.1 histidine phosphatase family protein [Alcaligenaceae bacterium]